MTTAQAWDLVGGNPVPGSPEGIRQAAQTLENTASDAQAVHSRLTSLANGGCDAMWQGEAANAFREKLGELPDKLSKLSDSYGRASGALFQFANDSDQLEQDAEPAANTAEWAKETIDSLENQKSNVCSGNPSADTSAYDNDIENAKAKLRQAIEQVQGVRDSYSNAENTCVGKLNDASDAGIKNTFWGSVGDFLSGVYGVLKVVGTILVIAVIAIAIVLAIIGTGGAFGAFLLATGGALMTALAYISVATAVFGVVLALMGRISPLEAAWDVLAAIPFLNKLKEGGSVFGALRAIGAEGPAVFDALFAVGRQPGLIWVLFKREPEMVIHAAHDVIDAGVHVVGVIGDGAQAIEKLFGGGGPAAGSTAGPAAGSTDPSSCDRAAPNPSQSGSGQTGAVPGAPLPSSPASGPLGRGTSPTSTPPPVVPAPPSAPSVVHAPAPPPSAPPPHIPTAPAPPPSASPAPVTPAPDPPPSAPPVATPAPNPPPSASPIPVPPTGGEAGPIHMSLPDGTQVAVDAHAGPGQGEVVVNQPGGAAVTFGAGGHGVPTPTPPPGQGATTAPVTVPPPAILASHSAVSPLPATAGTSPPVGIPPSSAPPPPLAPIHSAPSTPIYNPDGGPSLAATAQPAVPEATVPVSSAPSPSGASSAVASAIKLAAAHKASALGSPMLGGLAVGAFGGSGVAYVATGIRHRFGLGDDEELDPVGGGLRL
ncbi:MAG: WXG100 family type VII secretion target [Actinomycetota bacterium]|nr:WXG100 family type VII secretion target [Actinomycetota bacterium]